MKDQLSQIFTTKFFFGTPEHYSVYMIPLAAFFVVLIVAGAGIMIFLKGEQKNIFGRYIKPFLIVGILGLIHVFARYESLPGLGTRFIASLLIGGLIVWVLILAFLLSRFIPKYRQEIETAKRFNRYLPKAKR